MFSVILATDKNFGIGLKDALPWENKEELKIFKEKTKNSVLIVGRKTLETLPNIESHNRVIYCVSFTPFDKKVNNSYTHFFSIESAVKDANKNYTNKNVFVIGGAEIYNYVFLHLEHRIKQVHISIFDNSYHCDKFINLDLLNYTINNVESYDGFKHYVLTLDKTNIHTGVEKQYLSLLDKTLKHGQHKIGRNGETKSCFGEFLKFDLQDGFPLLTTKKMFFKGVVEELLFFLRGDTNSKMLEEKGVNIWKGNTNRKFLDNNGFDNYPDGMMGPIYGYQWRFFNAPYNNVFGTPTELGVDQLKYVIDTILTDPDSRRIILTSYNPIQAKDAVLYPCHSIAMQFYVRGEYLDMLVFNRSQDLFHGVPFNIASSALLLEIIANITNKKAGVLNMSLGDCHIYKEHYSCVKEQLSRIKYSLPKLFILKDNIKLENINDLHFEHFKVENYSFWPSIKADMVC